MEVSKLSGIFYSGSELILTLSYARRSFIWSKVQEKHEYNIYNTN